MQTQDYPQPTPTVPAADAVKALYEALEALTGMAGGVGSQDVDRLVQAIKRSLVNPQGVTAASLLAAIVRYENVHSVVLPAYDEPSRA